MGADENWQNETLNNWWVRLAKAFEDLTGTAKQLRGLAIQGGSTGAPLSGCPSPNSVLQNASHGIPLKTFLAVIAIQDAEAGCVC
jgi:hypothetical protein